MRHHERDDVLDSIEKAQPKYEELAGSLMHIQAQVYAAGIDWNVQIDETIRDIQTGYRRLLEIKAEVMTIPPERLNNG